MRNWRTLQGALILGCFVAASSNLAAGTANALDLHRFWEDRCLECHGHAGTFAREYLSVEDGKLVGRHHKADLKVFLSQHRMGPEQAEAIHAMLLAQASTAPLFEKKCASCHGTAADFVKSSLVTRDAVVVGRDNQLPIAAFLKKHGKLSTDELPLMLETLARVMTEVGSPK
jgi:hypothetical protein